MVFLDLGGLQLCICWKWRRSWENLRRCMYSRLSEVHSKYLVQSGDP